MTSGETTGRLAAHSLHVLNPAERQNLHQSGNIIRAALLDTPEVAIGVYESQIMAATSPLVANRLKAVFEPHIDYARIGSTILDGASALTAIANAYHEARRSDRRTLVKAASQALLRLGLHADDDAASMGALSTLAERLPRWVLDGTVQQQVVCKLAIHLGLTNATPPRALLDVLRNSMIPALQTVVDIGAPATRDIALEGLGALLKILPDPKCLAPSWTNHDGEGDAEINKRYVDRRRRRYLLVGAIAGDAESQVKYFEKLRQPLDEDFDARVAYLRALPAIWRQTVEPTPAILGGYVGFLTQAASIDRAEADRLGVSRAAFARFREGVFTTISVMMRRDATPSGFDEVIARAVERLPLTLVGTAADGNAESRATIAIITAAGNVVAAADVEAARASHEESACHGALEVLFGNLDQLHSVWSNPGLAEGCFRSLPTILAGGKKWAAKGLDEALKTLRNDAPSNDFVALHRRVIANACLRTLLVTLVGRMHDRLLEFHIAADEQVYERDLDHAVAILLAEPTAQNIQRVFDPKYNPVAGARGDLPSSLSESVIAAAASANDLQRNLESSYAEWTKLDAPCQLLLTRILAAELRASSQEAREVARYPLLRKRLDSLSSVVLSDEERQERLWKLLSILPSQAAEAVHADLEEFVEYRSGRSFAHTSKPRERDPSDLPGYVLAMIDESVSLRLARHISREVDLNLAAHAQKISISTSLSSYIRSHCVVRARRFLTISCPGSMILWIAGSSLFFGAMLPVSVRQATGERASTSLSRISACCCPTLRRIKLLPVHGAVTRSTPSQTSCSSILSSQRVTKRSGPR